jgi:hypothetical protein
MLIGSHPLCSGVPKSVVAALTSAQLSVGNSRMSFAAAHTSLICTR